LNTNNGVKWRRFIKPKKVEQINDITYKSNKIKVGVNDMTVNDGENVCEMKKRSLDNTGDISPEIAYTRIKGIGLYTYHSLT